MKFKVSIFWRDHNVLDATATATMTWEILRLTCGQFGNAAKAGLTIPTLGDLLAAGKGAVFTGQGRDDTGYAEYHILCVEARS